MPAGTPAGGGSSRGACEKSLKKAAAGSDPARRFRSPREATLSSSSSSSPSLEEELKVLDVKLNQLKLSYEQYFLGSRPREPVMLRREVTNAVVVHSNHPIQNTALRFKFNGICSRFQAFKRQWDDTLRKIEQGTYTRHRFKAGLHERARAEPSEPQVARGAGSSGDPLFEAYVEARQSCGQDVAKLTPDKLEKVLERQRESLRKRYGDAEFRFRVVVENGRAKLKASRTKG